MINMKTTLLDIQQIWHTSTLEVDPGTRQFYYGATVIGTLGTIATAYYDSIEAAAGAALIALPFASAAALIRHSDVVREQHHYDDMRRQLGMVQPSDTSQPYWQ